MIINEMAGGGAGLNFVVKNAATLPETVKNGDIVIISSVAVGDWQIVSGALPTKQSDGVTNFANGDTVIVVGTSSPGPFNALKKNKLMVYPIAAYQHNGTSLQAKTAYIGISGSWINFVHTFLLKNGTALVSATEYEVDGGTVQQGAGGCTIIKTGGASGGAHIEMALNLTGISTVYVDYKTNSYTTAPRLLIMSGSSGDTILANVTLTSGARATASLDVSAISGVNRVRVGYWSDTGVWNMIAYDIYYR